MAKNQREKEREERINFSGKRKREAEIKKGGGGLLKKKRKKKETKKLFNIPYCGGFETTTTTILTAYTNTYLGEINSCCNKYSKPPL